MKPGHQVESDIKNPTFINVHQLDDPSPQLLGRDFSPLVWTLNTLNVLFDCVVEQLQSCSCKSEWDTYRLRRHTDQSRVYVVHRIWCFDLANPEEGGILADAQIL